MNNLIEQTIPPLYSNWKIEDLVGPNNIEEIKQKVYKYLNDPNLEKEGNNLYIYSIENGSGKTSIGYYILGQIHGLRRKFPNYISKTSVTEYFQGIIETTPIVAVKFANYLKFCENKFTQEANNLKKQVEMTPFLLLDDVSPWANSGTLSIDKREFVLLMMYRREHLLPTIITSNLVPDTFEKMYGATVTSKVLENFSYIEIKGTDVRPALFPDTFEKENI